MRNALLLLAGLLTLSTWAHSQPPSETLTAATLPDFLERYSRNFEALETAYSELSSENFPLRDESGQHLSRRHIEDRRKALSTLRQTARELTSQPEDLVAAVTLMTRTEELADDLFDLSQVAYDNDREVLGKRFSDLQSTMEDNKETLENYVLSLATRLQDRLQQLQKDNLKLQEQLKPRPSNP